jgi:dipeptidyl aminopeptidase/acylaminoacyl peptidase
MSFPNYTGSLGYGQKWVEELLGKVGRLEIDDVMASIKELIRKGVAKEIPEKQLYMGGSHGGFIGAHGRSWFCKG